jgi:glycosyltransferase involved in cell wall biosynthesis
VARIFQKLNHLLNGPKICIFHQFHKPPYGGGNQFLLALEKELQRQGRDVGRNSAGRNTKVCLFNSFNFDFDKLSALDARFKPKMVHRIAGPIGVYRGTDTKIDTHIWEMNQALADRTIFQSHYSYNKHLELGLVFKNPTVISNASDPTIFNRLGRITPPDGERKIKIIATAWSNNSKKGGSLLAWLDEHLDHTRYELTFVGQTKAVFKNAKVLSPVPSEELALILKQHDIYVAPSQDDPCSNALIEALTCGLPAIYLESGGHPELVKEGGEGFSNEQEMLTALDKIASNYTHYQNSINMPTLEETTRRYLEVFNS